MRIKELAGRSGTVATAGAGSRSGCTASTQSNHSPRRVCQKLFDCKSSSLTPAKASEGFMPHVVAPMAACRRILLRKDDSDPKISCAKQWRS